MYFHQKLLTVRTYNFLRRLINLACNRDQFLWRDIAARKTRAKTGILTAINDETGITTVRIIRNALKGDYEGENNFDNVNGHDV